MTFDPRVAPEPSDLQGRAIRITTAASALSTFFSDAPGAAIMENFSNPDLLAVWPMRDPTSQEGIAILAASRDLPGDYRADFLSLAGFGSRASMSEGPDAEAALRAEHARTGFRAILTVPPTHLASQLAFAGHLAAAVAGALRAGDSSTQRGAAEALADLCRDHLEPLASGVVEAIESHARSATFRGMGLLLAGLLGEITSFAEAA